MSRRQNLREVTAVFTRLGFTAFGGPAAHLALIEHEVVRRRNWLDRRHFLDLVSMINFIPGPNSTELAIHLGYLRAGMPGLIVAGVCFIAPAVLLILPLAWAYVNYGQLPQMQQMLRGVNACVIAIIAAAMCRLAPAAVKDRFTATLALLAAITGFFARDFPQYQPELLILAACGLAGALWYSPPRWNRRLPLCAIWPLPLAAVGEISPQFARMTLFFLKIGATLFGSGYLLVSYLRAGLVEQLGWLSEAELLTAITVGQVTPGPLLTSATFVGYLLGSAKFGGGTAGGVAGAILATIAIFLPSFCFIALLAGVLDRIRNSPRARGALDGLSAAVVALIFVVTLDLAAAALRDPLSVVITAVALIVLLAWNVNATWLILLSAVVGLAASWA